MNEKTKASIQKLKKAIESDRMLRAAVHIGIVILSVYILGKAFNGLAATIRGFNNLKAALNGK